MIIDYMVLLILPVSGSCYFNRCSATLLDIMTDQTLWFISILLFLANIVILPLITGRSIGKIVTGLQVVRTDGTRPRSRSILLCGKRSAIC